MERLKNLDDLKARVSESPAAQRAYERTRLNLVVGNQLRAARQALGLTQKELAIQAGLQQPVIARLESGQHTPRLDTVANVAGVLGVDTIRLTARAEPEVGSSILAVAVQHFHDVFEEINATRREVDFFARFGQRRFMLMKLEVKARRGAGIVELQADLGRLAQTFPHHERRDLEIGIPQVVGREWKREMAGRFCKLEVTEPDQIDALWRFLSSIEPRPG